MHIEDKKWRINMLLISALAIIIVGQSIFRWFHVHHLPITYDEASNYMLFSRKGIKFCMSYYLAPQNHILHSILTAISIKLPLATTLSLRLPSFLVGTLCLISFVLVIYRLFDLATSFVSVIFFGFSAPVLVYGTLARGYSLQILCAIFSFYAFIELYSSRASPKLRNFFILGVSSIIGHYTIPCYLYVTAPVYIIVAIKFLIENKRKSIVRLIWLSIIVGVITLLLYIPVFLQTGIDSLINNQFVAPKARGQVLSELIPHFKAVFNSLISLTLWKSVMVLSLTISLLLFSLKDQENKSKVIAITFYLMACPVILLAHSVVPFPRTWSFLIVPLSFLFAGVIYSVGKIKNNSVKVLAWVLAFITIAQLNGIAAFAPSKGLYRESNYNIIANKTGQLIMESEFTNIFCPHPLLWLHLQYQFKEAGYNYSMSFEDSSFESTAKNSVAIPYDLLVLDENLFVENYALMPESVISTELGNEYSIQLYCKSR